MSVDSVAPVAAPPTDNNSYVPEILSSIGIDSKYSMLDVSSKPLYLEGQPDSMAPSYLSDVHSRPLHPTTYLHSSNYYDKVTPFRQTCYTDTPFVEHSLLEYPAFRTLDPTAQVSPYFNNSDSNALRTDHHHHQSTYFSNQCSDTVDSMQMSPYYRSDEIRKSEVSSLPPPPPYYKSETVNYKMGVFHPTPYSKPETSYVESPEPSPWHPTFFTENSVTYHRDHLNLKSYPHSPHESVIHSTPPPPPLASENCQSKLDGSPLAVPCKLEAPLSVPCSIEASPLSVPCSIEASPLSVPVPCKMENSPYTSATPDFLSMHQEHDDSPHPPPTPRESIDLSIPQSTAEESSECEESNETKDVCNNAVGLPLQCSPLIDDVPKQLFSVMKDSPHTPSGDDSRETTVLCNQQPTEDFFSAPKENDSPMSSPDSNPELVICEPDEEKETAEKQDNQSQKTPETKKHVCPECGKSFQAPSLLKVHQYTHTGERPHRCQICGKGFTQAGNLRQHLQAVHSKVKAHQCEDCGKGFTAAINLQHHKQSVHEGKRPHTCEKCGRTFTWLSHLKEHELVHDQQLPFECPVCGKRFRHKKTLASHNRIHTGERPYSCSQCGKKFTQKMTLKNHELVHSDEQPHICSICGKKFRYKGNLKTHFRIHTGERPYVCQVCGRSFTQSSALKQHRVSHTQS